MIQGMYPNAIAIIQGGKDHLRLKGLVGFYQCSGGVFIETEITGLPETESNFLGFHIHEGGSCTGDGFSDTNGHFDRANTLHPAHAGDLPPLLNANGKAYMKVLTDRFQVEEIIGKTVVIHQDPDDFKTQPGGNAGRKIGCGVIRMV